MSRCSVRDRERFEQALRAHRMPCRWARARWRARTLPIDRRMVARELGFSAIAENSMDAVSDRDFAVDFLSAAALTQVICRG